MFSLGAAEIVLLLLAGLFLFGSKLPDLARYLGRTVLEFRREASSLAEDLSTSTRRAV